jgi:peptide/nickel transport system substrate-binding protein
MGRGARVGWFVLFVALAATACSATANTADSPSLIRSSHAEPGPVRPGGTLTVDLSAETDSFNPFKGTWSIASYEVANAVFEPLAAIDAQGIARPYLAESIMATADFMKWTITARPGVTFQNGEKFDAVALKKNLDTARTVGLATQIFAAVSSIDIVSDRAVAVTMSTPWATFPATLAMQSGYMAAPAMLDDPAGINANPIGTGPFAVQLRQRDSFIRTRKNPNYWRSDATGTRLPYLDGVDFNVVPDATSRTSTLAAGKIDAVDIETADALKAQTDAARQDRMQLITTDGTENDETVLALNTSRPPFDDPVARQALAYAIDQPKLATSAYHDAFPGAWGMFEPGSAYYISKQEAGYPEPDAGRAQQLAHQYQATHGQPIEFSVLTPPDPQYLTLGQGIQEQLAAVGIKVDLQSIEQTQLIRTVIVTGDFQAAGFVLRSAPTPDQSYVFLATKPNAKGLSLNFSRLDQPQLTAAMNAFRAASDPQSRIDAVTKVQKQLARNLPLIFLLHARSGFAFQNNVRGLHATTYPGSDKESFAPYATTPFYPFAWLDQAG